MDFLGRAARAVSPVGELTSRAMSRVLPETFSYFGSRQGTNPPSFASLNAEPLFVPPPVSSEVFPSQPPPPPFVAPVVASANASKAPSRVRKTPVSVLPVSSAPTALTALPPRRSSGRALKASSPIPPLPPASILPSFKYTKRGRNISDAKKEEVTLKEEIMLKEQFLKEQHEAEQAKKFLEKHLPEEIQKLKSETQTKGESEKSAPAPLSTKPKISMKDIVKRVIADQRTQAIQERIKLREQK